MRICWAARGPLNPRNAPRSFWKTRSSIPRQLAARLEIVESGHFLLMSISAAEQAAPHYLWIDGKERAMIICNPRSLAFALLIAALPVGFALAGGGGGRGGAIGAGVGAAGMGSAAVGGGAAAVGGGPPAGAVGGGSPGSNNPAGNGAAGTGNPSRNAGGLSGNGTNASPGITNATTTGGVIGGGTGVPGPAPDLPGGTSPEALSKRQSTTDPTAPKAVQGVAEQAILA